MKTFCHKTQIKSIETNQTKRNSKKPKQQTTNKTSMAFLQSSTMISFIPLKHILTPSFSSSYSTPTSPLTLLFLLHASSLLFLSTLPPPCASHGRLTEPPSRASAWRFGFDTPENYDDNQLFCGGKVHQWEKNKGEFNAFWIGSTWNGQRACF